MYIPIHVCVYVHIVIDLFYFVEEPCDVDILNKLEVINYIEMGKNMAKCNIIHTVLFI